MLCGIGDYSKAYRQAESKDAFPLGSYSVCANTQTVIVTLQLSPSHMEGSVLFTMKMGNAGPRQPVGYYKVIDTFHFPLVRLSAFFFFFFLF